jgi:signal transduction histidine kinase
MTRLDPIHAEHCVTFLRLPTDDDADLARATRVSATLRGIRHVNRLIARERDAATLIRKAAQALVGAHSFEAVSIVYRAGRDTRFTVATQGGEVGDLCSTELPACLLHVATHGGMLAQGGACERCPLAVSHGTRDAVAVPIEHEGERLGALTAVLPDGVASDPEEVEVLRELAADLGVGLHGIELDASLRENERALRALAAALEQRVAERTAELCRAAQAKDEFLASMSHELRTPLNAILGLAEVLGESVYGPLSDKQRGAVGHIAESGRHLLSLINDILDVAKVEAGKVELTRAPVDVLDLCQASVRLVQAAALGKQQRISLSCPMGLPALHADERRLKQVLVNLLTNAVKFTPEGGQIALTAVLADDGESLRLAVEDSGVGIAEEDVPRLFQPFVQLDSGLARHHNGTGLGLTLVRRLVDLHGGSVALVSRPGQGSRFTVTLPVEHGPPTPPPGAAGSSPPPPVSSAGARRRVLLAEDDETNIATLQDYLESRGFEVHVARDGHEAIARAAALEPDVILMDIQMPGVDGLTATRAIRAAGAASTPIVALTALAMPGDEERCLAAGASAYLAKPVSMRRLLALIERLGG